MEPIYWIFLVFGLLLLALSHFGFYQWGKASTLERQTTSRPKDTTADQSVEPKIEDVKDDVKESASNEDTDETVSEHAKSLGE